VEDRHPGFDRRGQRAQSRPVFRLGRDTGIVDQGVQRPAVEAHLDVPDRPCNRLAVAEIDLDVIFGAGIPGTPLVLERVARTGDDPPAGLRKKLDGRMPDTP